MANSQRYADFSAELAIMIPYLTAGMVRFQVQQTQIDALTTMQTDFNAKWAEYLDPTKRTQLVDTQMHTLYTNGKFAQSSVQQQIKNNGTITLTDEDYANLYIHKDATIRTPAGEIIIAPRLAVTKNSHLANEISTTDPTEGKENVLALPADVTGISRYIAIAPADDPAPDRSGYHAIDNVGRSRFIIMSQIANKGVRKWLICKYFNTRHSGPESDPISFLVN